MRVIIAGSRSFNDYKTLSDIVDAFVKTRPNKSIEIVSGNARGVDRLGEDYARERGYNLKVMPADWDAYGKGAGYRRNAEMLNYALQDEGVLLAFWDRKSKGTKHMIDIAREKNIKVYVIGV